MSRDSAFRFKGKTTDAQAVAKQLGVQAVFEGRVLQRDSEIEISAELVDARDDTHIWGQRYSRKTNDIFVLQDDLAREMTTALRMKLTGDDGQRTKHAVTPVAYQDYLQGRYWWNKKSEEGFNKSIKYFQSAIALDPQYPLAYSGLADAYSGLAGYNYASPIDVYPKAKEALLRAMELDDTLAEAHSTLAYIEANFDWNWSGAEAEFQRAITLNPNYGEAYRSYGMELRNLGRFDEAISQYKKALELDPLSLPFNRDYGYVFYMARRYDEAIRQEQKTLEADDSYFEATLILSRAYLQKSMYKEAVAALETALVAHPLDQNILASLGYAYGITGRKQDAEKILATLNELSKHKYIPPAALARVYIALGEKESAFGQLERSYVEHSYYLTLAKVDPVYDPLRSDPRFNDLLRRLNFNP